MMDFRTVKNALVQVIGDQSLNRFRVIGYQVQNKNADALVGNNRLVQVYYSDGSFPKSAGRMRGPKIHELSIDIDMSASAQAEGDVSVIESETSTFAQKSAAVAAIRTAAERADVHLDEVIDAVYQIVMDARNENLGLPVGVIASRWVERIQKDTLMERGDLVVKTATMRYTCRVSESVPGDIGNEPETVIFSSDNPVGDTIGAGVSVTNDNE